MTHPDRGLTVRSKRLAILAALAISTFAASSVSAMPAGVSTATAPSADLAGDTEIFADNFESGSLSNWTVVTAVNGKAGVVAGTSPAGGAKVARLTVPDYANNSI